MKARGRAGRCSVGLGKRQWPWLVTRSKLALDHASSALGTYQRNGADQAVAGKPHAPTTARSLSIEQGIAVWNETGGSGRGLVAKHGGAVLGYLGMESMAQLVLGSSSWEAPNLVLRKRRSKAMKRG